MALGLLPPPLLVVGCGASWHWLGLGALAWGVALALKAPVTGALFAAMTPVAPSTTAIVSGVISSLSELGVAALVFSSRPLIPPAVPNVLAFGAGAACVETLFVLGAMYFESPAEDQVTRWRDGAKVSFCVRHVQAVERLTAFAGHIGARGLMCVSIYTGRHAAGTVALLSFALTDGLAAYGSLKNWNWFAPTTCHRFYGACMAISALETALFVLLAARML